MPGSGLYPSAIWAPITGAMSSAFDVSYPFRGVLHTTESNAYNYSPQSYYGHTDAPHFTAVKKSSGVKIYQHFSVSTASRACANPSGGVETNRAGAIQIEIAWTAANIQNLPDVLKEEIGRLIDWISVTKGIQRVHPQFFDSAHGYGSGSISRMSAQQWRQFNGWCGHQHVPENVHWDPGLIDIAALL